MSKSTSRDQVQTVIAQMRDVRGNRSAALRRMLNENEKATRETVSAELEVKNYKAAQKRLKEEISMFQKEVKQAKAVNGKTQDLVKAARVEAGGLLRQNTALAVGTKKLQKSVDKLKLGNSKLEKAVNQLDAGRDKLSADAKRLKDLKSKYLSELAKYKTGG